MIPDGLRDENGIQHRWDLTPAEAVSLQRELAAKIDCRTPLELNTLRLVAGVDVGVKNGISRAAIVVLSYPALTFIESACAEMPTPFPYIPGLLSFREGEVILAAHQRLSCRPDVYLFDGQGIAHPRRLGIASHIGLWLDAPTIGCAKTRLIGEHAPVGGEAGSRQPLWDAGEVIGMVLRTRSHVKPVYVSVGHRATLETAVDLVMRCITRYRLPEPTRAAHHAAMV